MKTKRPKNKRYRLGGLMRRIQRASQQENWPLKNHLLLAALRQFPCLIQVEIDSDDPTLLLFHGPSGVTATPIGVHVPADVAKRLGMLELIPTEVARQLRQNL